MTSNSAKALFLNDTYQLAEDLTVVRGNHQFGVGANLELLQGQPHSTGRTNGNWIFNGSATAWARGLLVGRVTSVEHGGPNRVIVNNWHMGLYAQDSWRASSRVTVNVGRAVGAVLRPERREQRDRDLQDGELPAGDQEHRCSSTRRRA